jgi:hypothetical protein
VTVPRWLLVLLVVSGLFVMHGITASTASAAAPCGVTAPHDQHGLAAPSEPTGTVVAAPDLAGGHDGALCLAVLVGGLVVGLLARRTAWDTSRSYLRDGTSIPASSGRAPPGAGLSLLCVSRT